jgi:hypothetical protein
MALSVKLYRVVGKGKDRRYVAIALGRRGRRSKEDCTSPRRRKLSFLTRSALGPGDWPAHESRQDRSEMARPQWPDRAIFKSSH